MSLGMKIGVMTGYLTAGFVSYVATNAAFESKSGMDVLNPHEKLSLYMVDAMMACVGAAVNYAIGSYCSLYRASDQDYSGLGCIQPLPQANAC